MNPLTMAVEYSSSLIELVLHSLPVPRLAECMLLEAWDYSTTKTLKTASDKVATFEVVDILKLTQVHVGKYPLPV